LRDVVEDEDSDGDSESLGYLAALEGESDDGEEGHGDYVAEDGTKQLLDDNLLSPAATSVFIDSLGPLLPSERDSLLLLEDTLGESSQVTGTIKDSSTMMI